MTAHYSSRQEERAAVEARRRAYRESRCGEPHRFTFPPDADFTGGGILYCQRDKGHENGKPSERRHHAGGIDW